LITHLYGTRPLYEKEPVLNILTRGAFREAVRLNFTPVRILLVKVDVTGGDERSARR